MTRPSAASVWPGCSEADRLGKTALADLAAAGKLSPTIAATYPLDQVADAHSAKTGPG